MPTTAPTLDDLANALVGHVGDAAYTLEHGRLTCRGLAAHYGGDPDALVTLVAILAEDSHMTLVDALLFVTRLVDVEASVTGRCLLADVGQRALRRLLADGHLPFPGQPAPRRRERGN